VGMRYSGRFGGGGLECIPREARMYHDLRAKKRWPIRCRACRHKSAVWMTKVSFDVATFCCSKCGSKDVAKSI
jgi:hypothetical protein